MTWSILSNECKIISMDNLKSLPYDFWVEDALCGVIRRSLEYVSVNGMPDGHHFYITFQTSIEGVEIPKSLSKENPKEMTIILQYQFEELTVDEDFMSVKLHFYGKPEHIVIPFSSISYFADPSVNFGLELKNKNREAGNLDLEKLANEIKAEDIYEKEIKSVKKDDSESVGEVIALDTFRKRT